MGMLYYCYIALIMSRFMLTVIPETGYIHPDEFFQSPEIVYGDLLDFQVFRPWEFKPSNPLRCITFPYVIVGIPAIIIKFFGGFFFHGQPFFPFLLLILPRLIMCLLSLIHDLCIMHLCELMRIRPAPILMIFASSYIPLVHFTRTFSNSTEAVCYTLVNYLIIRDFIKFKQNRRHAERVPENETSYLLGILISMGCFIRPTFVVFSFVPMIFYILFSSRNAHHMIRKVLCCLPGFVVTSLFLAIVDTIYYQGESVSVLTLENLHELLQNLVLTPWNFIKYNSNAKNVASHGDHPRWLHFLINVPMTFSLLGLYGLHHFLKSALIFMKRRRLSYSKLETFFLMSFIFPLSVLSVMPHQEPRFLIPLLFPLVFLCGNSLFSHCEKYLTVGVLWIITNVVGLVIFGFVHQGGMFSVVSYFHSLLNNDHSRNFHLVFYHTYLPPRHLMAIPNNLKHVHIHDLGEKPESEFIATIERSLRSAKHGDQLFIIVPSAATISMVNVNIMLNPDYRVRLEGSFFPHLSTEDLQMYNIWRAMISRASVRYKFLKLRAFFTLDVYKVEEFET